MLYMSTLGTQIYTFTYQPINIVITIVSSPILYNKLVNHTNNK